MLVIIVKNVLLSSLSSTEDPPLDLPFLRSRSRFTLVHIASNLAEIEMSHARSLLFFCFLCCWASIFNPTSKSTFKEKVSDTKYPAQY